MEEWRSGTKEKRQKEWMEGRRKGGGWKVKMEGGIRKASSEDIDREGKFESKEEAIRNVMREGRVEGKGKELDLSESSQQMERFASAGSLLGLWCIHSNCQSHLLGHMPMYVVSCI